MKKTIFALMSLLLLVLAGCSDVEYPDAVTSPAPTNLSWTNDGRKLTLTWTLPAGASGSVVYKDNVMLDSLGAGVTSYTIKRAEVNTDNYYTVKAKYSNGLMSEGTTAMVNIKYDATIKTGFLLLADDYTKLEDDDERAAAEWFNTNYVAKGTGAFIKPADVANLSVDEYPCLMIIIDRVGLEKGWQNLPKEVTSIVGDLKNYVQSDGRLLLTNHATQLVEAIGRTNGFAPNLFASGEAHDNTDVWGIQAVIGNVEGQIYDHTKSDLYTGLETGQFNYGHNIYPLVGSNQKEDHNCMWDLNAYGLTGNPNVVKAFEDATNSTVLGTWQHVVDYCCAAVVDFAPTDTYTGRIVAIGPAAYEFHQPDNPYQSNIEKLTANAIAYLSK
jgi:hypothetical protein